MEAYLNDKFTHYVKDKAIQESVLDSNPLPEVKRLNTPKVDDYLGEIFEYLDKSYGKGSDSTLCKTQARISNVMGPLSKLWLNLQEVRTGYTGTTHWRCKKSQKVAKQAGVLSDSIPEEFVWEKVVQSSAHCNQDSQIYQGNIYSFVRFFKASSCPFEGLSLYQERGFQAGYQNLPSALSRRPPISW